MENQNNCLDRYIQSINDYCDELISGKYPYFSAKMLCTDTQNYIPSIYQLFPLAPDIVLAKNIIEAGVKGLDDIYLSKLWNSYYLKSLSKKYLPNELDISLSRINRLICMFPSKIGIQLWESNYEICYQTQLPSLSTNNQKMKKFAISQFALSQTEANIVYDFLLGKTRKEICNDLFIAPSTLKSHIRKIINKTGTPNMVEAIIKINYEYETVNKKNETSL